jgi:hypothetical protein
MNLLQLGLQLALKAIRPHKFMQPYNVRFGSKADIRAAKTYVRFTPNSDRERVLAQTVMSALPPEADMCGALSHVC